MTEIGPARHIFHSKWRLHSLVDAGYISAGKNLTLDDIAADF